MNTNEMKDEWLNCPVCEDENVLVIGEMSHPEEISHTELICLCSNHHQFSFHFKYNEEEDKTYIYAE
jgi:C4-type Zn-finger protein